VCHLSAEEFVFDIKQLNPIMVKDMRLDKSVVNLVKSSSNGMGFGVLVVGIDYE
jgi:hypothetical protein